MKLNILINIALILICMSNQCHSSKKPLVDFILTLLLSPSNKVNVEYSDKFYKLKFQFLNPEGTAQEWSAFKNSSKGTYDKFSRALRVHYGTELITKGKESFQYCIDLLNKDLINDAIKDEALRTSINSVLTQYYGHNLFDIVQMHNALSAQMHNALSGQMPYPTSGQIPDGLPNHDGDRNI